MRLVSLPWSAGALKTVGEVQTTAKTTAAGLTMASTNAIAKKIRTARDRRAPVSRLFVR
jgi:hypothetical protein